MTVSPIQPSSMVARCATYRRACAEPSDRASRTPSVIPTGNESAAATKYDVVQPSVEGSARRPWSQSTTACQSATRATSTDPITTPAELPVDTPATTVIAPTECVARRTA